MKKFFKFIGKYFFIILGIVLFFVFFFSYIKESTQRLIKWLNPDNYSSVKDDSKATISDYKAGAIADTLHVAMSSMGTDFVRIKQVLQGLTVHDFAKVHNKFGIRGYIDTFGVGTDIPTSLRLNLTQWMESELNHEQFKELKKLHPTIF